MRSDRWAEPRSQRGLRRTWEGSKFLSRCHRKLVKYFEQYMNVHSCLISNNKNANKNVEAKCPSTGD